MFCCTLGHDTDFCGAVGGTTDVAGTGELSDNKQDAHTLKDILHLRRHHKH